MKTIGAIAFSLLLSFNAFGWGQIGHRTIGLIAQKHLSKKALNNVKKVLGHESMAVASMWMDEERSNPNFSYAADWHWVTIPEGKTYQETDKNPNGDVIQTINRLIDELEKGGLSNTEEVNHVRMLIHLVGDIHMPLHVGTGEDKGGNALKVKFFWEDTNLHTVWDSKIIDSKQFSYSELAKSIDHVSKVQVEQWQNASTLDWAQESKDLRELVYDLPEDNNIRYHYIYRTWPVVQQQLVKAGIRLAGVLNRIYG